jgi:putative transposase
MASLARATARRRHVTVPTPLSRPGEPNALWCADYKGEFMLRNRRYCYPLTITDFATRYLKVCEALSSNVRFTVKTYEGSRTSGHRAGHRR